MHFEKQNRDGKITIIANANGNRQPLPALWLRERAPTPDQLDGDTHQRLINPHQFDVDLHLTAAEITGDALYLEFSDAYQAAYPSALLASWIEPPARLPEKIQWRADSQINWRFSWPDVQTAAGHFAAVEQFLKHGLIILTDSPRRPGTIRQLAKWFGYIRDTNFGQIFDVRVKTAANDLAYKPIALGPHTDNPYREPTPGIQLLHCLRNDTSGGETTMVDSLACVARLQQLDPEGYQLLATVPIRFAFQDRDDSLEVDRPILATDARGQLLGLHYSPRLDWLPLIDEDRLKAYQRARKTLSALFVDPAYELRFRLNPGDCAMFDNNRILHGRTGYDDGEGRRHLQGCYIDRDGPESLYRRWRRDQQKL